MLPPHIVLIKGLIKMIFKESDLNINNANFLDDCVYLTEDESKINISTIPVMENTRLNASLVDISYVEKLAEENGISLIDAVNAIQEQNDIDNISVVIDEERIISDPDIVNEINNVIIKPMSENDPVAVYVESVCDAYLESQDTKVFDNILDENKLTYGLRRLKTKMTTDDINSNANLKRLGKRSLINGLIGTILSDKLVDMVNDDKNNDINNLNQYATNYKMSQSEYNEALKDLLDSYKTIADGSKRLGAVPAAAAQGVNMINAVVQHFRSKPKNIVEKVIIKLRRIYHSWMLKARDARKSGEGNIFKNSASIVLQIIDKLLGLIQKGAHKIG